MSLRREDIGPLFVVATLLVVGGFALRYYGDQRIKETAVTFAGTLEQARARGIGVTLPLDEIDTGMSMKRWGLIVIGVGASLGVGLTGFSLWQRRKDRTQEQVP